MTESPQFKFDPKSQRYKYVTGDKAGQFVAQSVVSPHLLEQYIDSRKESLVKLTKSLLNKDIGVGSWESAIAKELKEAHIVAYSLGKGGYKRLNSRDYGLIGSKVKGEYQYLRGFSEDILSGNLSEAQILNRLQMYVDSLHSTYEKSRFESHKSNGFTWEKRNLDAVADHCDDCLTEANKGWRPLGTLRQIGDSQCLTKCRCVFSYLQGSVKPTDRLTGFNTQLVKGLNIKSLSIT